MGLSYDNTCSLAFVFDNSVKHLYIFGAFSGFSYTHTSNPPWTLSSLMSYFISYQQICIADLLDLTGSWRLKQRILSTDWKRDGNNLKCPSS
jgi:hypothetical protein